MALLAQHGHWLESCSQCGADDLRVLHDHEGLGRMQTVAKLRIGEFPKHLSARGVLMGDVYDRHDDSILLRDSSKDENEDL